jgi:outer membrane biogenesis lipoprotein LolB
MTVKITKIQLKVKDDYDLSTNTIQHKLQIKQNNDKWQVNYIQNACITLVYRVFVSFVSTLFV